MTIPRSLIARLLRLAADIIDPKTPWNAPFRSTKPDPGPADRDQK